jgi:hypothetical protein
VDKVTGRPGNKRAALELSISNDRIKAVKITRTDNDQSQTADVNYQTGIVTVSYTGLAEGRYPFMVVCLDQYDNESVPVELYVSVYGDEYQSELTGRACEIAAKFGNGLTIGWRNDDGNILKLVYTSDLGQEVAKMLPLSPSNFIPDYGSNISYYTYYIPEVTAVDTFSVGPVNLSGAIADYTTYVRASPAETIVHPGDFDLGGEGVGFHDSNGDHDPGGGGANYRPSRGDNQSAAMDIEGDGGNIGYTNGGEWLMYTVEVLDAGDYEIDWYISVNGGGAACHIEVDGLASNVYALANNWDWSDWRYYCEREGVAPPVFHLTVGKHKVMYYFDGGDHNYNGLKFKKV